MGILSLRMIPGMLLRVLLVLRVLLRMYTQRLLLWMSRNMTASHIVVHHMVMIMIPICCGIVEMIDIDMVRLSSHYYGIRTYGWTSLDDGGWGLLLLLLLLLACHFARGILSHPRITPVHIYMCHRIH